ncbi:MAG: biotin/lipoyl-containing protein [Acholeplasma sp.]|nr:biotin/lipoyl-containing protein [Acholeplasma sp.]
MKEIQKIIKDFEDSKLTELELEYKEIKLRLSKNEKPLLKVEDEVVNTEKVVFQEPQINLPEEYIYSPLVGTFYDASSPGKKPFIEVGKKIKKGDVIGIIEAMKIMNEITSNVSGVVKEIHFKTGDVVGFNDKLITVETDAISSK